MNKRKGDEDEREHRSKEHHDKEHQEKGHPERERPRRKGREREVQLEFLKRRWQGSAPPTGERYTRALRQWRQLPGAIGTTATDLGGEEKSPPLSRSKKLQAGRNRHTRGGGHRHGA